VRPFLVQLGATLKHLFASLVVLVEHVVWKVGHEWSNPWFLMLSALALIAAWWGLRGHHLGRHGR
jgi:hypothetical protein